MEYTLRKSVNILLLLFLIFAGLYYTRAVLIPFALAGILAMLLLPLSRRMEQKGINRPLSAAICVVVLLAVVAGLIALVVWQITDLAQNFEQMQRKLMSFADQIRAYLTNRLGISNDQQKKILESGSGSGAGGMSKVAAGFMGSLVDTILVLVYVFIFIYFRTHLKKFILKLVPAEKMSHTEKVIQDSSRVAYKYLSGLGMMIVMLWILYGIGFSLVGIENALLFAVLCGILEIVPFVGNLTGTAITVLMALTQGGGGEMVAGVVLTYFTVQFIQSYILEPLVVGAEVNINPMFTILSLVVGETLWGIPGLVLAIPLLGIVKIICDNVEFLKPFGYLIGEEKKKNISFADKMKSYFSKDKGNKKASA